MLEAQRDSIAAFVEFLDAGRASGASHAAAIRDSSADRREASLEQRPGALSYHTLDALLDEAYAALDREPRLALELTELVLRHVDRVPLPSHAAVLDVLLRGRAWRERGNALRVSGDRRAALDAFTKAAAIVANDPALEAEHATARRGAALALSDLGHTDQALNIIREGWAVFDQQGDARNAIRSRLYEGAVLYDARRYAEAADVWRKALAAAESIGDTETASRLHNNLGHCARLLQNRAASADHLARADELFERYGMSTERLRAWDGQSEFVADDGDVERALAEMNELRDSFLAKGLEVDAARTELDMIELEWLIGRGAKRYRRAAELVDLFVRVGIIHEALRAHALLQTDEARRNLSPDLTTRVASAMRRIEAERRPQLIP